MQIDAESVEWSRELSAFDHMMYRADADSSTRTSMTTIELLDSVPDWDRLTNDVERATRVALRLRQHVVAPVFPISSPRWVTDPDFDLDYHMRRVALPAPATMRELLDLTEKLHATPLDMRRPLWEMTLVEGLDLSDGKAAIIWKLSHALTDGIGGMVMERMMRHDERDPDLGPMPPIPIPEDISPLDLTRSAVRGLPASLVRSSVRHAAELVGHSRRILTRPDQAVERAARTVSSLAKMATGDSADPSPLLQRRGLNRRFDELSFPLAQIRGAAKAHGCSVNDAYIAGICGGLRLYHEAKGVPIESLPLAMPINIRPTTNDSEVSNQWAAATLAAPVGTVDPVERMKEIHQLVLTARSDSGIDPVGLFAPVISRMPQAVLDLVPDNAIGIDIQASNVPGHPHPRYLAGARLNRMIPIGPLPGAAAMITMLSTAGKCDLGINCDTAAVTDPDLLVDCLRRGFDEVFATADSDPVDAKQQPDEAVERAQETAEEGEQ